MTSEKFLRRVFAVKHKHTAAVTGKSKTVLFGYVYQISYVYLPVQYRYGHCTLCLLDNCRVVDSDNRRYAMFRRRVKIQLANPVTEKPSNERPNVVLPLSILVIILGTYSLRQLSVKPPQIK